MHRLARFVFDRTLPHRIAVIRAEGLSIGTTAIPRLAALARNDNCPSFRAKARSAVVEESPSCWPKGSLSGQLRFLDSLRSLGMTNCPESPSSWPKGSLSGRLRFLDSLRSLGMTTAKRRSLSGQLRFLDSLRSLGMTTAKRRSLSRRLRFLDSLRSLGMTTWPHGSQ